MTQPKKKLLPFDFLLVFVFLLFSFSIFGFQPLQGNNVHYLPHMEKLKNPSLFKRDIIFEAFKFHPSLFYRLIVSVSKLFGLEIKVLIIILSWLTFYFLAVAIFMLCLFLFNNKQIGFLSLFFLLSAKYCLSLEPISINLGQLTQTTFCLPFAVLALLFFLKRKWKKVFLVLGLIANFQLGVALQLLFLLSFAYLIERKLKIKNIKLKRNSQSFLKDAFCILLTGWPIGLFFLKRKLSTFKGFLFTPQDWLGIVKIRLSHHFFPSLWSLTAWIMGIFFLSIYIFGLTIKKEKKEFNKKDLQVVCIMIAFIPVLVLQYLFSELIPWRFFILLNIARVTSFFVLLCVLYGAFLVYQLINDSDFYHQIAGVFLVCVLFLPSNIFYNDNLVNHLSLAVLFLMLLLLMFVVVRWKNKISKEVFLVSLKLSIIAFLFLISAGRLFKNYQHWGKFTFNRSKQKQWVQVQQWAQNNTPSDSLFIVPPDKYGFRVFSQRSIVGDFKDGASLLYHPFLYQNWWGRMKSLGVNKKMADGAFVFDYNQIKGQRKIRDLAVKYKADYLVSEIGDLKLRKIYNNNSFSVYKIQ